VRRGGCGTRWESPRTPPSNPSLRGIPGKGGGLRSTERPPGAGNTPEVGLSVTRDWVPVKKNRHAAHDQLVPRPVHRSSPPPLHNRGRKLRVGVVRACGPDLPPPRPTGPGFTRSPPPKSVATPHPRPTGMGGGGRDGPLPAVNHSSSRQRPHCSTRDWYGRLHIADWKGGEIEGTQRRAATLPSARASPRAGAALG